GEHLAQVIPRLHRPLGGLLGTHVPLVPDEPRYMVNAPAGVAAALVLVYGLLLILAARRSHASDGAKLLLAAAFLALAAFPFPVRSGPDAIRFLTPLYVPLLVVGGGPAALSGRGRRAWFGVPGLAALPLGVARRLSPEWPARARAEPPFLLPNLDPVRDYLLKRGIRRVYASYGPAW